MIRAFVFARGGSKGLPGKNLRYIKGKTLLRHAIDQARASRHVADVTVSTDDYAIELEAKRAGARVLVRPPELCTDDASEWLSWQHAIANSPPMDVFVSVPCTTPLRSPEDIDRCIEALADHDLCYTVTPWDGYLLDDKHTRRQEVSRLRLAGSCYAARPGFIREGSGVMTGRARHIAVPPERAIDINTPLDFRIVQLLMEHGCSPV